VPLGRTGCVRSTIRILLLEGFGFAHFRLLSCSDRDRQFDLSKRPSPPPRNPIKYNFERLAEEPLTDSLEVAGFSPHKASITAEQDAVTMEGGKAERPVSSSLIVNI